MNWIITRWLHKRQLGPMNERQRFLLISRAKVLLDEARQNKLLLEDVTNIELSDDYMFKLFDMLTVDNNATWGG